MYCAHVCKLRCVCMRVQVVYVCVCVCKLRVCVGGEGLVRVCELCVLLYACML